MSEGIGLAATAEIEQVVDELRARDRFLLTAHEGPDGDALGSLLGMHHLLTQLGKDSVMFMAAKEFPLPIEYRFLPLEEVFHEPPADMADRTVVFLDCGNIDRMPVEFLSNGDHRLDQHRPPPRQHPLRRRQPGRHRRLLHGGDRLRAGAAARRARSPRRSHRRSTSGLVTDTGKFMYENTDARTHRIAAELIDAGVEVDDTYRRLYEHVPLEKLRLVSRALDGIQRRCDGRLVLSYITDADYEATGAGEEMTEGIIDHLRSVEGSKVAALIRDLGDRGRAARKVSLRSSDGEVDVSAIARKTGRRGAQARRRLLHGPRVRRAGLLPLRRGHRPARLLLT